MEAYRRKRSSISLNLGSAGRKPNIIFNSIKVVVFICLLYVVEVKLYIYILSMLIVLSLFFYSFIFKGSVPTQGGVLY